MSDDKLANENLVSYDLSSRCTRAAAAAVADQLEGEPHTAIPAALFTAAFNLLRLGCGELCKLHALDQHPESEAMVMRFKAMTRAWHQYPDMVLMQALANVVIDSNKDAIPDKPLNPKAN